MQHHIIKSLAALALGAMLLAGCGASKSLEKQLAAMPQKAMLLSEVTERGLTLDTLETGGLTTTYSWPIPVTLPNSGLKFHCSDRQYRHLGTTGPRGVLPDIPLEIGYKYLFRSFTAEELQQMIEMSNSKR